MWSKLRSGGRFIFSHDIAHVSSRDLESVLLLLTTLPVRFSCSLLVCESLVIGLEFLELLLLIFSAFVFKHTSHSGYVFGLLGVLRLLFFVVACIPLVFSGLLLDPFLLKCRICLNSLAIAYN
jgi:Ca2+/H+ antiporter